MKKILIDSWGRKVLVDLSKIVGISAVSDVEVGGKTAFKFDILVDTAHVLNVYFKTQDEAVIGWIMLANAVDAVELELTDEK